MGVLVCCLGTLTGQYLPLGALIPSLAYLGLVVWLLSMPSLSTNKPQRQRVFAGAAFAQGLALAPLAALAGHLNASLFPMALVATTLVFGCFSLSAAVAKRRSYLFLAGVLSSALSALFWWRLGMAVFARRSAFAFEAELLVGLAVFVGYVLVDTQVIIERASAGDLDEVKHAVQLFGDFVSILVRVVILLMQREERARRERRQRRRDE